MARQMDPAEARARADTVLDNSGDVSELHRQVDALAARLIP
jgi:dephospho-CoA kinase